MNVQKGMICDVNILQCLSCKSELTLVADNAFLLCNYCKKTYPIVGGIPVLFKTGVGEQFNDLAELNIQDALAVPYNEQEFVRLGYDRILPREVKAQSGEFILNLGAGRGFTSKFLLKSDATLRIVNFELVFQFLKMASCGEMLVNGSADSLPFKDNTFDRIVFSDVLEHIPPAIENDVLREMYRVLKPGGTVYVSFPGNILAYIIGAPILNFFLFFYRFFDKRLGYLSTKVCPAHINMNLPHRINRSLQKAGFLGKLYPRAQKFFYLPEKMRWIGSIFNLSPLCYLFIPQMTGFLNKAKQGDL